MTSNHIRLIIFTLCLMFIFISCEKVPEKRHYAEIVISPTEEGGGLSAHAVMQEIPMHDAPIKAQADGLFTWQTPQGWSQKPGSAMRLATFAISEDGETADCSIVSLGQETGSLKANVERWAGQVGVVFSSDFELEQFLSKQSRFTTDGGFAAVLVDLSGLQGSSAMSIVAGMISLEGHTFFVKMTGPKKILTRNRDKLKSLCKSFKAKK